MCFRWNINGLANVLQDGTADGTWRKHVDEHADYAGPEMGQGMAAAAAAAAAEPANASRGRKGLKGLLASSVPPRRRGKNFFWGSAPRSSVWRVGLRPGTLWPGRRDVAGAAAAAFLLQLFFWRQVSGDGDGIAKSSLMPSKPAASLLG